MNGPNVKREAARELARSSLPSAVRALLVALTAARRAAVDLQQTIDAAGSTKNASDAIRADVARALLVPTVAHDVGAIVQIIGQEHERHAATMAALLAHARVDRRLEAFAEAMQEGMIDAAAECPCRSCACCIARDKAAPADGVDTEQKHAARRAAVAHVLAHEQDESALVTTDGAPLRASGRVLLV